jgi:hypothetical protein
MIRLRHIAGAVAVALALAPAAVAKGPSAATISGPGLASPLKIDGDGEGDSTTPLGVLVTEAGFFPQVFGQSPSPLLRSKPSGTLGSRYVVTYEMPGPTTGTDRIRQDLYPYAAGGAVSHMEPNQVFWSGQRTVGGWMRGTAGLQASLVAGGLPRVDPESPPKRAWTGRGVEIALGAGVLFAGAALTLLRGRRRGPVSPL